MAYDSTAERVFCFGGMFAALVEFPNNMWEWNGSAWKCRRTLLRPRGRSGASFSYSPQQKGLLLYGGYTLDLLSPLSFGGKRFVNETWFWNRRGWTQLRPPSTPQPSRSGASMAYDVTRKSMILFGGSISLMAVNPLDETWAYDGRTWKQRFPKNKPNKRSGSCMAYHPKSGKLMLFGGGDRAGFFGDTWEWDGTDWKRVAGQIKGLGARVGATMLTIPWKKTVYLVGGSQGNVNTNSWPLTPRADLWQWTGKTWTLVPNSKAPFTEVSNGAAADPKLKRILVTGGKRTPKFPTQQRATWSWDGKTWTQVAQGSQQESNYASYALDPRRDQILALVAPEPRQPSKSPLETWVLPAGGTWTRLKTKTSPPGYADSNTRGNPRMVWHEGLGLIVMVLRSVTGHETWLWDGTDWKRSSSKLQPESTQICYDSLRKKILAMEYDVALGKRNMWAWDIRGWVKTHRRITGPGLMIGWDGWAYDPIRDRIVAFYDSGTG